MNRFLILKNKAICFQLSRLSRNSHHHANNDSKKLEKLMLRLMNATKNGPEQMAQVRGLERAHTCTQLSPEICQRQLHCFAAEARKFRSGACWRHNGGATNNSVSKEEESVMRSF